MPKLRSLAARRATLALLALSVFALPATAQAPAAKAPPKTAAAPTPAASATARAAATITAADIKKHIGVIADDSMLGRDTPSRGLDLTAQYVADQFKRFGLRPGGDEGTWFQRYAITRRQLDVAASAVKFEANGVSADAEFTTDARWFGGTPPAQPLSGEPVFVGAPAPGSGEKPDPAQIRGRIVGLVADLSKPAGAQAAGAAVQALVAAEAKAILMISNRDSARFAQLVKGQSQPSVSVGVSRRPPIIEIAERTIASTLNFDLQAFRDAPSFAAKAAPGVKVTIAAKDHPPEQQTAPNTIGIIEGTDPVLKKEYVVFSAHMDHIGIRPGQADSIANGADDDGSGTVGLIELAEAFSRPGARPKRSLLFIGVSGEEKGLWGSEYFAEHPTVPLAQVVADLNMDMIGRNWKDSIVAIGKEHSDLGETLNRVNAAHPELRMTAIDDIWPNERFYFRSDHFNFARKGVPILFFFNGTHADYHQVSDSPDKIDTEKMSRIIKLVFFLGQDVGNRKARPVWNPASYKQIVEGAGR